MRGLELVGDFAYGEEEETEDTKSTPFSNSSLLSTDGGYSVSSKLVSVRDFARAIFG